MTSRSLSHPPDAPSQSRELLTQRSHNNPHQNYRGRTICNHQHQTPSHKWAQTRFPHQALPKSTNLNLSLFRLYLKIQILTPCLTRTRGIPIAPMRNHTSVPSYPHGRPTNRPSDSRLLKSRHLKSPNLRYPSMVFSP